MAFLELFSFLHFVGLAWGVGGATIGAIIFAKSEKNPEMGPAVMKIMPEISKLVWLGLILLLISGVGVSSYVTSPIDAGLLAVKHVVVVLIVIFGIIIGISSKKLIKLAPKPERKPSPRFLKTRERMKYLGIFNLFLWYLVIILAVFV